MIGRKMDSIEASLYSHSEVRRARWTNLRRGKETCWMLLAVLLVVFLFPSLIRLQSIIIGWVRRRLIKIKRKKNSKATLSMEIEAKNEYDVYLTFRAKDAYDVFLSFRGSDTRVGFTDHLYHYLTQAGLHVFKDDEEMRVGEEICGELLKALNTSRIYIPIFSLNFATSSWCLREVAHMVQHRSNSNGEKEILPIFFDVNPDDVQLKTLLDRIVMSNHMVQHRSNSNGKKEILPIFFDVNPDDVKLKTQLYRKAMSKHKKKFSSEQLKQWENALVEVAQIKGWVLSKYRSHAEVVKLVVEEVLRKIGDKRVDVPENLVEDHRQIKAIIEKLDVDSGGVRFIWLHGMGGIGKTTLAKIVFNKLYSGFDGVCFLNDIQEATRRHGLINLQKKLISSIGGSRNAEQIEDIRDGMKRIERVCNTKKVLIVLDNLDKKDQLKKLVGKSNWFGSGSRIIITTRDKGILMTQMASSGKEVLSQPEGTLDYEVYAMEFNRALQLFSKHAFGIDFPVEDYVALSKAIVVKVDRLPLAVEVIGSFLYCCNSSLEPHFDKIKLWKDTMKKLDRGPFEDVRDVLMMSYEGLENEQKEVFLDIACFFTNEDKTYPIIMWDNCNYDPHIAISVLLQRSLIKIGDDNKFWMHDQVRDLGRYINLKEYPHKLSRAWIYEDAVKLLKSKERNEDVKALSLTSDGHSRRIAPRELAALPNLRFLRLKDIGIFGNFDNLLLKQRWLFPRRWQTFFSANDFHFHNLIMLDLSDSNIEDGWGGWSQMKKIQLKVLNLTGCIQLKRTPDFSNLMSLEMLILARCVKLTRICRSIGKLKRLQNLHIKGCKLLCSLPAEIGSLQSLTEIIMPQNFQPFKLPETFGNLKSLSSFILDGHPQIIQLPNSIGGLLKLTHLSLRGCVGIKELPWSIGEMETLVNLDLSHSGIVKLPDSIGYLEKLKVIVVSYTRIRKFPHTIGELKMLEELHAKNCRHMRDENLEEIKKLSHLRILDLSYTLLSRFPSVLSCLSHLHSLEFGSSHLQEILDLPLSLKHLHMQAHHFPSILDLSSLLNLDYLEFYRLTSSTEEPSPTWTNNLPEEHLIHPLPSGLSTLKFRGMSLLPSFSNLEELADLSIIEYQKSRFSVSPNLIHLTKLKLSKCKLLMEIAGLSLLKSLRCLELNTLESLVEIHGLSKLESLLNFCISHCCRIERLSNLSKLDKLQQIEIEDCPKIRAIEGLEGLESLELDNHGRNVLERSLDGKTWDLGFPQCPLSTRHS